MKANLSKLYLLLLGAGYDKKMFEEIVLCIKKNDQKKMIKEFGYLITTLEGITHSPALPTINNEVVSSDIKEKIYNILIIDAGLSISRCLQLMNENIKLAYPKRKVPLMSSKKGFFASMSILERYFNDSELLHIANRLRNNLVHNTNSDSEWMLKE